MIKLYWIRIFQFFLKERMISKYEIHVIKREKWTVKAKKLQGEIEILSDLMSFKKLIKMRLSDQNGKFSIAGILSTNLSDYYLHDLLLKRVLMEDNGLILTVRIILNFLSSLHCLSMDPFLRT